MQKAVLIGASHIDILAGTNLDFNTVNGIDLPGEFVVSVGGTAFNVCVGLLKLGIDCLLISAAKENSLFTSLIKHLFTQMKLKHHLICSKNMKESAFLGIRNTNELIVAVTAQAWEDVTDQQLHTLINKLKNDDFDFLVLDCNLLPLHIKALVDSFSEKPIYLCATSVAKFNRFLSANLKMQSKLKAIFMNEQEYEFATKIFGLFTNQNVLYFVTCGSSGVMVYENGKSKHYLAPYINAPVSFSGAGDAFAAGVIYGLQNDYNVNDAVGKGISLVVEKSKYPHSNILPVDLSEIYTFITNDKLTGVLSRNLFEQDKYNLTDYTYVLITDIDHFKKINDTFGHDYGDVVLQKVAQAIKSCIRKEDRLYRYGGEEFVLFLYKAEDYQAAQIAERIRVTVQEKARVTVTVGVSPITEDIDLAIKQADQALYRGKQTGRNKVVLSGSF